MNISLTRREALSIIAETRVNYQLSLDGNSIKTIPIIRGYTIPKGIFRPKKLLNDFLAVNNLVKDDVEILNSIDMRPSFYVRKKEGYDFEVTDLLKGVYVNHEVDFSCPQDMVMLVQPTGGYIPVKHDIHYVLQEVKESSVVEIPYDIAMSQFIENFSWMMTPVMHGFEMEE